MAKKKSSATSAESAPKDAIHELELELVKIRSEVQRFEMIAKVRGFWIGTSIGIAGAVVAAFFGVSSVYQIPSSINTKITEKLASQQVLANLGVIAQGAKDAKALSEQLKDEALTTQLKDIRTLHDSSQVWLSDTAPGIIEKKVQTAVDHTVSTWAQNDAPGLIDKRTKSTVEGILAPVRPLLDGLPMSTIGYVKPEFDEQKTTATTTVEVPWGRAEDWVVFVMPVSAGHQTGLTRIPEGELPPGYVPKKENKGALDTIACFARPQGETTFEIVAFHTDNQPRPLGDPAVNKMHEVDVCYVMIRRSLVQDVSP